MHSVPDNGYNTYGLIKFRVTTGHNLGETPAYPGEDILGTGNIIRVGKPTCQLRGSVVCRSAREGFGKNRCLGKPRFDVVLGFAFHFGGVDHRFGLQQLRLSSAPCLGEHYNIHFHGVN